MKKVFAFLSALVLTLACVGLTLTPVQAADPAPGMFIEDPTLGENDIPMYIMDSIKTTFPKHYDNDAKADPNWQGSARLYAWNETKLKITQFDENGATGKFYTPYFAGVDSVTNPDSPGAGEMLYAYPDADKISAANFSSVALTSLSYVRFNYQTANGLGGRAGRGSSIKITGVRNEDLRVNLYTHEPVKGITYILFDGEGKAVRGFTNGAFFQSEMWQPLHGYNEEGQVVPVIDETYSNIRRIQVPIIDEETGEPTGEFEDGGPDLITKRVLWQYFEEEPGEDLLNPNGYLGEGWDPDKWDYYLPEQKVAILYSVSDGRYGAISEEEAKLAGKNIAVYEANDVKIEANGDFGAVAPNRDATIAEYNAAVNAYNTAAEAADKETLQTLPILTGHVRKEEAEATIPAGGIFYLFGYLDRGTGLMQKFNELYLQGFLYGRHEDYKAEVKTYNFSAGAVKVKEYFTEDDALVPVDDKDGKHVFEVLPGTKFRPARNVDVTPMATYWGEPDKIWTFTSDVGALQYKVDVNNKNEVLPYPYANKQEMVDDFLKDFNAFRATKGNPPTTIEGLYDARYDFIDATTDGTFMGNETHRAKWGWIADYIKGVRERNGLAITYFVDAATKGTTGSLGTFAAEFQAFMANTILNPGAWNRTSDYTIPENANGFLPEKANDVEYNEFEIDTTGDKLNTNYVVRIDVTNKVTQSTSTIYLTYIVTDVRTPIIKLNNNAFFATQGQELKLYDLATATDGYGNKSMPYGNDISPRLTFVVTDKNGAVLDYTRPLPAGRFTVVITVENQGRVDKKIGTLVVADTEKPRVQVVDYILKVPYGGEWTVTTGILAAVDNNDGDLLRHNIPGFEPFVLLSDPIDTTKPGRYNVEFDVYDSSGNKVSASYAVQVVDPLEDLQDRFDDIEDQLSDIQDSLVDQGGGDNTGGCQAPASTALVAFASGIGLLASVAFVVLRRKH